MKFAEGPNGEILEFPDDIQPEVMQQAIKKYAADTYGQETPEPTGAPEPVPVGVSNEVETQLDSPAPQGWAVYSPKEPMLNRRRIQEGFASPETREAMGRNTAIATGATIGGAIGTPLGPAGMVGGSVLGAAAGEALVGGVKRQPPMKTARKALAEAETELLFTGGIAALRPFMDVMKGARRAMLGVGQKEMAMFKEGQKFGVELSPTDVSRSSIVRNVVKVVGRFPFLGTPAQKQAAIKAEQVFQGKDRLLVTLGPAQNLADVGVDLNKAARNSFKGFRDEARVLYENARQIADDAGEVIPTENIKKLAGVITENFESARPGRAGKKSQVVEFAESLAEIPDNLNGTQYQAMADDLDVAMTQAKKDGFAIKQGMNLKYAAELDLRSSPHQEFVEAINKADDYFARGVVTFDTPTAKRFNRVRKGGFQVGISKPGTLNEDELFKAAFNTKSPKAMLDLRKLVGKTTFDDAVRNHIEDAFSAAQVTINEVPTFNPDILIKKLGLLDQHAPQYKALQTALKGTELSPKDFVDFADVARKALSAEAPEVSTFLARRAVFTGAKGGLSTLLPGLAVGGGAFATGAGTIISPIMAVMATLVTRQGIKVLSDPRTLKLATRALAEDASKATKLALYARLARLANEEEQE